MLFVLLAAVASAACPAPSFSFQGQPACVEVAFDGAQTQVTNRCADLLLVDQTVLLGDSMPLIPTGGSLEIRDLSAFTLGLGGQIYPVFAVMDVCEEEAGSQRP